MGLGQVVVSSLSFVECHCSTCGPPYEQLLVRLGRVVHHHLSSIIIIPHRLSFPCCLLFVVPLVVCRCRCRTALVHPQSTRQAVAHQCGGGCSDIHRHCPHCRRSLSLSLFIVVVPVVVICCPRCCHLLSFVVVIPIRCCHSLSSFVVIVRCRHSLSSFVVIIHCHHLLLSFVRPSLSFLVHCCSFSSVVHPLVPPTVHPTSSCS
jgi:hypothetical protein